MYGPPLTIAIRSRGTHQVEIMTATIANSATREAAAPPGARNASALTSSADIRFRIAICAANVIAHPIIPPNKDVPMMYREAPSGSLYCSTAPTTAPAADTTTAVRGTPFGATSCSMRGANPDCESEYSIRLHIYKVATEPESAAVSATKFIAPEAACKCANSNTVTKGDSVTPIRFHGTTPTSTVVAPM